MAITRKPKVKPEAVDVDALIHKGGSVAGETGRKKEITPIILRVPSDIIERVDLAVKNRRVKTPRHTWLIEAILEKLDRE
ncbi:hypothetical protein SAMN02949497_4872 [Methylomagnum ishizawai]|uniref:Uncharacterized protein n=1 Tax=Methylomagnum ishizawai TaxID=1760988 RepID=A0A1Y6D4L4_9GAMM|nr:hypothetical protein [Methylomagnum ishizawai]SMF97860.1 hypothetical protein SAMN02949497_4839 [Methylomagnum ishizawai]SMF97888.1 hypothetical protein SAMN02949497_4872 [Methylomagnum ishizawai]